MYKSLVYSIIAVLLLNIVNSNIINKNVERKIDLTSQLVLISATITLENTGKNTESSFLFILEPNTLHNVSYLSGKDSLNKHELKITPTKLEQYEDKDILNVKLNQLLLPGHTTVVHLEYILANSLIPYPSSIILGEQQLVQYFGNHYFYSPYVTTKQTTSVITNSQNIENYTKLKPVSITGERITYGPYDDIKEFQISPMIVHFENNAPFLTVTHLERLIEVSHWSNIAVQENIDILHTGAKLKGSFSRYDYQHDTGRNYHSIKSYKTILPATAHNIYYRDSNGNISTSNIRVHKKRIELELRPRYPLFGGWRSSYTLGYNIPTHQHLYKAPNGQYIFRMRLIDNVFNDMYVKELETHILLPIGATNVKLSTPYEVERLPDSLVYKYLDTKGHMVIRLRKNNLVEQHIQDFEISYNWQPVFLLHEPILLSVALYIIFLVVIIFVRFDFSLPKQKHVKTQ